MKRYNMKNIISLELVEAHRRDDLNYNVEKDGTVRNGRGGIVILPTHLYIDYRYIMEHHRVDIELSSGTVKHIHFAKKEQAANFITNVTRQGWWLNPYHPELIV